MDFSESSVRAFAHATAIAGWYDAQLTVLHVVPTFEPIQVRGDLGAPVRVVTPMPREQVLEEMSRTLNLAPVSPRATPIAEAGDPQTTVIDQAISKKADLIVMGTDGRRGFKRLLLGSVTEAAHSLGSSRRRTHLRRHGTHGEPGRVGRGECNASRKGGVT